MVIQTQSVLVPHGDLLIDAYLAYPTAPGRYPGVVVIQEIFGVNDHIRALTARLAQAGYVAIAPALYQRLAPGFAVGYDDVGLAQGRELKNQTQAAELLGDLQSAIAYLATLPQVEAAHGYGAIGFCFGGHVAYLAATLPEIRATASFYGAGIATMTPGGGDPTIERTGDIHGTIYCFFGLNDPLIPLTEIEQIQTALETAQIDHQIYRYDGVGHGFVCDQRDDYNETAAQDAWQKTLALFAQKLSRTGEN